MRASIRHDLAEGPGMMPSVFESDQQLDRLAPAQLAAPHGNLRSFLDADDEIDAEDLYLDLGVGD
jgi:hypothetical protein